MTRKEKRKLVFLNENIHIQKKNNKVTGILCLLSRYVK